MKLVKIGTSPNPIKKYRAYFADDASGAHRTIDFGMSGANDFTLTGDKDARDRYRVRHRKDLLTPQNKTGMGPGALSYWVLWGDSTSMRENIKHYKNLFHL